jgi:hypothetical protein
MFGDRIATKVAPTKQSQAAKQVDLQGPSRSILHDRENRDGFTLDPFEPEFIEIP